MAARPAPMAHAMAKMRPTVMPWAIAASWSKAVARIAIPMPAAEEPRRTTSMTSTVTTIVTISVWEIAMRPDLEHVGAPRVAERRGTGCR